MTEPVAKHKAQLPRHTLESKSGPIHWQPEHNHCANQSPFAADRRAIIAQRWCLKIKENILSRYSFESQFYEETI